MISDTLPRAVPGVSPGTCLRRNAEPALLEAACCTLNRGEASVLTLKSSGTDETMRFRAQGTARTTVSGRYPPEPD